MRLLWLLKNYLLLFFSFYRRFLIAFVKGSPNGKAAIMPKMIININKYCKWIKKYTLWKWWEVWHPPSPPPSHPFFYALASYNKCFARKSLCKFHEVSCPLKWISCFIIKLLLTEDKFYTKQRVKLFSAENWPDTCFFKQIKCCPRKFYGGVG